MSSRCVDADHAQDAFDDAAFVLGTVKSFEDVSRPPAAISQQSWLHGEATVPIDERVGARGDGSIDVTQPERAEADAHAIDQKIETSDPPSVDRVRRHLADHEANRVGDDADRVDLAELLGDEVVALTDVVDHAVEHVLRKGLLARRVVVEGAETDVGRVGDLLDRRRVDPSEDISSYAARRRRSRVDR